MITNNKELYITNLPEGLPIYFQPEFLDTVDKNWEAVVCTGKNGVEWMMPFVKRRKYGVTLYGPVELAPDNALIVLKKQDTYESYPSDLGYLNRIVINDRRFTLPKDSDIFSEFNVTMRDRQYINLKEYPRIISDFPDGNMRNLFRKCDNCRFIKINDIERFYRLYKILHRKANFKEWSFNHVVDLFTGFRSHFQTDIFILVDENGRDLTAIWVIYFQRTVYGISLTKNYEIKRNGAQEHLLWQLIQVVRRENDVLDLGGSDISGIKSFNMKIGAENVTYPVYELYKPRLLKNLFDLFR